VAHHRFVWIHPFINGNGRTARLLTYAMLCKLKFIFANDARLYNPTAVFSNDRQKYYDMLEAADTLNNQDVLKWCDYFLLSILDTVKKTEKLTDKQFVNKVILLPAIANSASNGLISNQIANTLKTIVNKGVVKAIDIKSTLDKNITPVTVSRYIKMLKQKNLIKSLKSGGREYTVQFTNNVLTYSIMEQLSKANILPTKLV
jgi:Fic family protein